MPSFVLTNVCRSSFDPGISLTSCNEPFSSSTSCQHQRQTKHYPGSTYRRNPTPFRTPLGRYSMRPKSHWMLLSSLAHRQQGQTQGIPRQRLLPGPANSTLTLGPLPAFARILTLALHLCRKQKPCLLAVATNSDHHTRTMLRSVLSCGNKWSSQITLHEGCELKNK